MKTQLIAIALVALTAGIALGQQPETSDPDVRLIEGFDAPGEYPTGVTAANMNLTPKPGSQIDGTDEDVFRAEFPSAGPIAWTTPRMNAGDIALSIGPAFPDNALSYPSGDEGFQNNFQALSDASVPFDEESTDLTTLAWRVSSATGAHLATTRHNGVDEGYVLDDNSPVGPIHGIAYVSAGPARQGFGFSMDDGIFANGNGTTTEVHTGHAGFADGRNEAVFNIATAYFPYEAGWKGAWVVGAEEGEAEFFSASEEVNTEEVTWESGLANVQLVNVNSASDGMLFVAPSNGSSSSRIASAFPNESGGWTTTVRLDEIDDPEFFEEFGDAFQFLYVPYSATNLIGGLVDGADGSTINASGDSRFSLSRQESGQYALSVLEADGTTKKNGDAGMLILSVADTLPDNSELGSQAFMSYEYDEASGDFIIESRSLAEIESATPFDGYGNRFAPSDSDFYFAWVDFENPLSLGGGVPGDFDGNGALDVDDLDTLIGAVVGGSNDATFDLDGNGDVDPSDVNFWVAELKNTWLGDSNLDGEFNSGDLVAVFGAGEYEDTTDNNSSWAEGDWNSDGDFTTSDLVAAFGDGGYEAGIRPAANAIPEPTSIVMLFVGLIGCAIARKRRKID